MRLDDPEILDHLREADPVLGGVVDRVGPCRLRPDPKGHPYEWLFQAIAYQQLNGRAAETILRRVMEQIGDGKIPAPKVVLATDDARLRACGLSRGKTAAVRDLAARTLVGDVPSREGLRELTDTEIVDHLTQVRGVGPWTVEMLLMFRLGRPDVLPVHDYGVRNGFRLAFRKRAMPTPRQVAARGERWRPWRTVASWYLWRAVDLAQV